MSTLSDPLMQSIRDVTAAYRQRTLSPVEVTRAALGRIATLNPTLHAYIEVVGDAAMAQARASEQRFMSGMPTGLLEGIPIGVKDLLHIEGMRTTAGSPLLAQRAVATETSTAVSRLMGAGAVILGKTHLVEFAYGGWGTNQGMGTPRNPWDMHTHRVPGGSSSGSGVAVAGGLAMAAVGTDTGGSVRIPAAFCGLTGLKTTQGRISNFGTDYVSFTLDTIGPMTRTADDAALLLQAMHGPDYADRQTLGTPPQNFVAALSAPVAGLRFSVVNPAQCGPVDEDVAKAMADAINSLRELGCVQHDAGLSIDFTADQAETGVIISSEAYQNWGTLLEGKWHEGDTASRGRIAAAKNFDAAKYAQALHNREARKREFARIFDTTDVLVLPTVPKPARALADVDEKDLSPSRLTRFAGYYGLCAISLPCGFSRDGLPIGLQLVAAPFREDIVLRLGAAFQRHTDFHRRVSPAVAA